MYARVNGFPLQELTMEHRGRFFVGPLWVLAVTLLRPVYPMLLVTAWLMFVATRCSVIPSALMFVTQVVPMNCQHCGRARDIGMDAPG